MGKSLLADARRRRLVEQLFEKGSITVGDSAAEFGVSTETIRKDILHLERMGLARKCFGGAVLSEPASSSTTSVRVTSRSRAKAMIAARAIAFVPQGASVFIDGGTTTFALNEHLSLRDDLTVFTNSMSLVGPLSRSQNAVFVVGGRLRGPALSNVGTWAVQAMQTTKVDVAFLGTDGLKGAGGPTTASYDEADFKATVIRSSQKTFVLADSSKFTHTGLFVFSGWGAIGSLITDDAVSVEDREAVGRETEVLVAVESAAQLGE